jgi:Zn-dependent alcohol dehydrogenase
MRTRAAVLRKMGAPPPYRGSRPLEIVELELAPPGPGELLIRVRAAGLCHSDLSVIDGSRPRVMPMVLGHEAAGEVVEAGSAASEFRPGDHVVLSFVASCNECATCWRGRPAMCEPAAAASSAGTLLSGSRRWRDDDGAPLHHHLGVSAFAEHIVVSERSAVPVADDLPLEIAALFGCAVLSGAGAVLNAGGVRLGDTVAVFGMGGVGLSALMGALAAGASQAIAVDVQPSKLELARQLGASAVVLAGADAVEEVRALSSAGVDCAIETVGSERVLADAYAATRRGGTTIAVGLPHPDRMLVIQAVSLVAEERVLRGSYLGSSVPRRDVPRFVSLYRSGRLPVERLLDERITFEQLNEGFDRLADGRAVRQILVP